jgi:hypothetical protein
MSTHGRQEKQVKVRDRTRARRTNPEASPDGNVCEDVEWIKLAPGCRDVQTLHQLI